MAADVSDSASSAELRSLIKDAVRDLLADPQCLA
jgi:hypothetical protein